MDSFENDLAGRLQSFHEEGLLRTLRTLESPQGACVRINGQQLLNFSSNDYLGFAHHPVLKAAAVEAIARYGTGTGASRLICGSLKPHQELEEELADFKDTEAALVFSSGYAAAIGTICAIMGRDDVLLMDQFVHASIIDAARLSGAQIQIFRHNDLNDLERLLLCGGSSNGCTKPELRLKPNSARKASRNNILVRSASLAPQRGIVSRTPKRLIITESIFSMDGDRAPLDEIVHLKEKYGAWLMVDEAHATGIYGPHHRGLADELGVAHQIEVQMGTLGKALGAAGGFICGSRSLIHFLINRARSFIFSTAPAPGSIAAAMAGIRLAQSPEGDARRKALWAGVRQFRSIFSSALAINESAIVPIIIGGENETMKAAAVLRRQGFFIPGIRYPSVSRNAARLRITFNAEHSTQQIQKLVGALKKLGLANPRRRRASSPQVTPADKGEGKGRVNPSEH